MFVVRIAPLVLVHHYEVLQICAFQDRRVALHHLRFASMRTMQCEAKDAVSTRQALADHVGPCREPRHKHCCYSFTPRCGARGPALPTIVCFATGIPAWRIQHESTNDASPFPGPPATRLLPRRCGLGCGTACCAHPSRFTTHLALDGSAVFALATFSYATRRWVRIGTYISTRSPQALECSRSFA